MKTRPYKNIVGENIRRLRQERHLTQEELALMSGLSQGYINQLESGKRRFTQKTLFAIADGVGMPPEFFLKDEKKQDPKILENPLPYVRRPAAREFLAAFRALPPHVAEHYLTLMSIERNMIEKKKR